MIITEVTDKVERPGHIGHSGVPRTTDRVHVTDILNYLQVTYGFGGGKKGGFDDIELTGELGFCWEEALEWAFGSRFKGVTRPDEVERDGIVGSPDGLEEATSTVHEYKLKWKSSANFVMENEWRFQAQSKSYCCLTGYRKVRFWVCFVMASWGKFNGHVGPQLRVWDIEYSKMDLWEHWNMMKENKKDTIQWLERERNQEVH